MIIRENGVGTYFASDIAYHFDKRQRGHDLLIDVWGADHHGYVSRVRGALVALGAPGDCFEVTLMQLVSLFRGGEKLAMGKREGNFVTLRDLRNEVGNDACRFFYLLRSHDQALDFDLELAKSRSNENPVYYIQYAHARVSSVMKQLGSKGYTYDAGAADLSLLTNAHEQAVITAVSKYPEIIEQAALEPRAAFAGALPARPCEHAAHLLQRRTVHRRGSGLAQRAPDTGAGCSAGDPQRPRHSRRVRARDDVGARLAVKDHQPRFQARPPRRHAVRCRPLARVRRRSRRGPVALAVRADLAELSREASGHRSPPTYPSPSRAPTKPSPATPRKAPRATTSTTCCPSSKWWCRRRTAKSPAVAAARREHRTASACTCCRPGSYRQQAEADRIRAQLKMQGIDANVQRVAVDDDVWHRVRIGPITDLTELNRLRARLRAADFDDALVIRVGD